MQPLLEQNELFKGTTKELWYLMYNFVCTRCFGWGLPCIMMVPMVDYLNHLPIDTNVSMFNLEHSKDRTTNYSMLFKKDFVEKVDDETEFKIKGAPQEKKKPRE